MEQLPAQPSPTLGEAPDQSEPVNQQKKPWYKRWWTLAIAAVVVIACFSGALNGGGEDATATSAASPTSGAGSSAGDGSGTERSPSATPARSSTTPTPSSTASTATPTPIPTPTPTPTPTSTPTPTEEAATPADPADYEKLGTRDLALITKNPDSHTGRKVQVYANITQFDAATGDCIFRGDTAYTNMADSWDYEHNSVFMGEGGAGCEVLSDFVADDEVFVLATVGPSFSYDTQIGGSTTVPTYFVDGIELVK